MAGPAREAGVSLHHGWMRRVTEAVPAAGYFTLKNDTGTAKFLTGAASPDCGQLMLHESQTENGQARMAMMTQVPVPPYGSMSFSPGDYHLMCEQPSAAVQPGARVPVTLRFADGGTVAANFVVRGAMGK